MPAYKIQFSYFNYFKQGVLYITLQLLSLATFGQQRLVFLLSEKDCGRCLISYKQILKNKPDSVRVELWATSKNAAFVQSMVEDKLFTTTTYFSTLKYGVQPASLHVRDITSLIVYTKNGAKQYDYENMEDFSWVEKKIIWSKKPLAIGQRTTLSCGDSVCLLSSYSNSRLYIISINSKKTRQLKLNEIEIPQLSAQDQALLDTLGVPRCDVSYITQPDSVSFFAAIPQVMRSAKETAIIFVDRLVKNNKVSADTLVDAGFGSTRLFIKRGFKQWAADTLPKMQPERDIGITDLQAYSHDSVGIFVGDTKIRWPFSDGYNWSLISATGQEILLAWRGKQLLIYGLENHTFHKIATLAVARSIAFADINPDGHLFLTSLDGYFGHSSYKLLK